MKQIIIFVLFFISIFISSYQFEIVNNDTLYIKGYEVDIYKKQQVEIFFFNKKLKKKGENCISMIDYQVYTFFIPLDSLLQNSLADIILKEDKKRCSNNFYNNYFFFQRKQNINYVSCKSFEYEVKNSAESHFYSIKSKEKNLSLYKIKYIEGDAVYKKIDDNTRLTTMNLDVRYCRIPNKLVDHINCYFFCNIKVKSALDLDQDFQIWHPNK